jgi:hypothetical protein
MSSYDYNGSIFKNKFVIGGGLLTVFAAFYLGGYFTNVPPVTQESDVQVEVKTSNAPQRKCCMTKKVTVCHELTKANEGGSPPFTHCTKGIELVECKNPVLNQGGERFCLQKIPLSDEVELTHLSECLTGC